MHDWNKILCVAGWHGDMQQTAALKLMRADLNRQKSGNKSKMKSCVHVGVATSFGAGIDSRFSI